MKTLMLVLTMLIPGWMYAQDIIVLKDKSEISARIVHEDKEYVEYLDETDHERTLKRLSADEVKKVKYENMTKNTNLIEIDHDSLKNEFLLNDIINHLIMSGYAIEKFDNNYYTVSTEYVNNDRLAVKIKDNTAVFRSFQKEYEVEVYPYATATITWDEKPEPGEKRGYPGSTAFKKLDEICRTYLKDGNGVMHYNSEQ